MNGASAQATQTAPSRETQVQSEMGRQGQLVEKLYVGIQIIEGRLQPVLRDQPPAIKGTDEKAKMALVGHASAISNQNDQLENLVREVQEIIERLEL